MKNILTLSLLLTCGLCFGQNLVPNPSFEEYDSCAILLSEINYANDWLIIRNTPDCFNNCATSIIGNYGIPENDFGYQYPPSQGCSGYAGFFTAFWLSPNGRELFGARLKAPLVIGQKYFVSFKASHATANGGASNNIGITFTNSLIVEGDFAPNRNFSHVNSTAVISDTTNWTTVFGSFTADSAYSFINVGNFYDDNLTQFTETSFNPYYFIDDICVSTDSSFCANYIYICNVGINEHATGLNNSAFPNPFSNQLTFSLAANEPTTVSLYDFLGQQILQQTFTNSTTINTAQIQVGIYFYELSNSKRTLKTGKLVKQ